MKNTISKFESSQTQCLNLRPSSDGSGTWRPAGVPRVIAPQGWQPLAYDAAAATVIIHSDNDLAWVYADGRSTAPEVICTLPSAPLCAVLTIRQLTVMTADGPFTLGRRSVSDRWLPLGLRPDGFGTVRFDAQYAGVYESTAGGCDTAALGASLVAAYERMADSAAGAGALLQPVVARARLLDADGAVLHVTPPVAVMLPVGGQMTDTLTFDTADNGVTVDTKVLQLEAYKLAVTFAEPPTADWGAAVASAQIQVTPQLHPLDGTVRPAAVGVGHLPGAGQVRVTMPGVLRGLSAQRVWSSAQLLRGLVEHFDDVAVTVAVIANPFTDGVSQTIAVPVPQTASPTAEAVTLRKTLAKPVTSVPADQARLLPPHTFVARQAVMAVSNPMTAVWGDVTPRRYTGDNPLCHVLTTDNHRCAMALRVRFADGTCQVTRFTAEDTPMALSPMLSYPSAESVELSINVTGADNIVKGLTVPLQPDATGTAAIYVSPAMAPITLGAVSGADVIDDGDAVASKTTRCPATVVAAQASSPLRVTAQGQLDAPLTALCAARSGTSAWEFGRSRVYAFTAAGARLLSLDGTPPRRLTAAMLSSLPLAAPTGCVASGADAVYALCDGGRLMRLAGHQVELITVNVAGDRLAVDADGLVVAHTDDCEARHYAFTGGIPLHVTDLTATGPWLDDGDGAFAQTPDGLVNLTLRDPVAAQHVRWLGATPVDARAATLPRAVLWPIKASTFDGTADVSRRWLAAAGPQAALITRLRVNGVVRSPLVNHLDGHQARQLQCVLDARVSPDFEIAQPQILA